MDKVRLGRILGAGARQAARTAIDAIDAATAPDPGAGKQRPPVSSPNNPTQPSRNAATAVAQVLETARTIERGKKQMKSAALAPIKRASRALWLEMTGAFFAIFAVGFAINVWRMRAGFHAGNPERARLAFYGVLCALFFYFSVSSFVRARRV